MTLKEFRDYFVRSDFYLSRLEGSESDGGGQCWLFYLSRGLISDVTYSRAQRIRSIPILKIYGDSTSLSAENIIISHVLFFRTMEMVDLCDKVDEWLKVRLSSQEIPWSLSQRLIEYYQDLKDYLLNYSSNLAKDIVRLWRDTLVIGRRKLLVVSDEEIDILEDFRDIVIGMLIELKLKEDARVYGIRIDEPDYSFL